MDQVADQSGWIMLHVLVMKQTSLSVVIMDGKLTIVITLRTSPYCVLNLEVSSVTVVALCVGLQQEIPLIMIN